MRNYLFPTAWAIAAMFAADAANAQPYGPGMGYGYGSGYGMMGGYGYGFGLAHLAVSAVFLVAVIAGVVWLVRSLVAPHGHHMMPKRSAGLDMLEERYARGEINREEYLQKKKDIDG